MKFGTVTYIGPVQWTELKFHIFENPRWQSLAILKLQKSRHLSNGLFDLCEIWHDNAKWLLTTQIVKNLNFKNPRRQKTAILKMVKSPHLCNRITILTKFGMVMHTGPI